MGSTTNRPITKIEKILTYSEFLEAKQDLIDTFDSAMESAMDEFVEQGGSISDLDWFTSTSPSN